MRNDKIKIEVKSTSKEDKFRFNSISPDIPEQKNQIILKLFIKKDKIKKFKFVKGKWKNITSYCLKD